MSAPVYFHALGAAPAGAGRDAGADTDADAAATPAVRDLLGPELVPDLLPRKPAAAARRRADLPAVLAALAGRLAPAGTPGAGRIWVFKTQIAEPGGHAVPGADCLAGLVRDPALLGVGRGSIACDTLSITSRGLDTAEGMAAQAVAQGYAGQDTGLPFVVADAPGPADAGPSRLLGEAQALAVLTAVRPHPHLGFQGAVSSLGLGLVDRPAKLALHRGIRPRVDTPLCAGCGSCQNVCLFGAIAIRGGRAVIDHQRCTGCGECMTVCFMAGIAEGQAERLAEFQRAVAASAAAARAAVAGPAIHFNLLLDLDRGAAGSRKRVRPPLGDLGVLAAADPVALDQATWDLVARSAGGSLQAWHGFPQQPQALLAAAEAAGLGCRSYRLRRVG